MQDETMNGKALHAKLPDGIGQRPVPTSRFEAALDANTISCLLIDDSKFDRQRLRRISEQTNLELSFAEAPSLDAALSLLRTRDFDVILLDQSLPDGEGTVAADLLRKHLGSKAPPIIMISGSDETAMPARAFASGCADYISKDSLSIPNLQQAIFSSIAKANTASPKSTAPMAEHGAALQSFADDTVLELRIPLSRMIRLISRATDRHPSAVTELDDLKTICREMWDYLDNIRQITSDPEK
jgi:CheY-like chemotaxis protein